MIFFSAEAVGAEPLLSCVLAGIIITNRRYSLGSSASLFEEVCILCHGPLRPCIPTYNQGPGGVRA